MSYSHKDARFLDELLVHLTPLERQGLDSLLVRPQPYAGDELDKVIRQNLLSADIILLLVSPDFRASNYIYNVEMKNAVERHDQGTARVIPVILRACDWCNEPYGELLAVPKDGKALGGGQGQP